MSYDVALALLEESVLLLDEGNMSFGGSFESQAFAAAVARAQAAGVVLVAAAGNSNVDAQLDFPAAYPEVVAVAALAPDGHRASFSNWGRTIDLGGPGVDVLSLRARDTTLTDESQVVDHNYIRASGTSMASPHAASVAALLVSAFPKAPPRSMAGSTRCERMAGRSPDGRISWAKWRRKTLHWETSTAMELSRSR